VLVRSANLRAGDLVYDLGAGVGLVTSELIRTGARVVAVERDPNLAAKLKARFNGENLRVVEADLMDVALTEPFKVVANIPFNLTAAVLRRLLISGPHPEEAALVLQREAAEKYAGAPRPTAISLMLKPWFDLRVSHAFSRRDFVPVPRVDVVLLRVVRRPTPELGDEHRELWHAFVRYAFARARRDARSTFRNVVSNMQWRRLSRDLDISPNAMRGELTLRQWLGVFRFVLHSAPPHRQRLALTPHAFAADPRLDPE